MKVTFQTDKLRQLCEEQRVATKKLGQPCAKKLAARLADLYAVATVRDLAYGNPHPLKGNRAGQFSLEVKDGIRLVFVSSNDPIPQNEDGSIDWFKVTEICIVFVGDYHD